MKTVLILLCLSMLAVSVSAKVLNIQNVHQEQDQWCWAGCSQAILDYYGISLTQTQIAAYGTDGENNWNWLYGQTTNPTRNGIDYILFHFGQLQSQAYERSLNYSEVNTSIDSGRPFVIRWGWNSGGGHFIVGKGYNNDLLHAMDPWYGSETINNYNWFVSGDGHSWTHTLEIITQPSSNNDNTENPENSIQLATTGLQSDGSVNIYFSIPESSITKIDIYNIKGQRVKSLSQKLYMKGSNLISWYPEKNASGVYLCRLQTESEVRVGKVIILR